MFAIRPATLCAVFCAGLAGAQSPTSSSAAGPAWRADYEAARAEAIAGAKLLLVTCCAEVTGERDIMSVFRRPNVLAALEGVVPVVASSALHGDAGVCPRFGSVTCAQHRASAAAVRMHLFGESERLAAQSLLLYPDGRVAWYAIGLPSAGEFVHAIQEAKLLLGKPVQARLAQQRALLGQLARKGTNDSHAVRAVDMLLVHAHAEDLASLLTALDNRADITLLLLRQASATHGARAGLLLEHVAAHGSAKVRAVAADLRHALEVDVARQRFSGRYVVEVPVPLPPLGPAPSLAGVSFVDGHDHAEPARGCITVLWFFLPDWPELASLAARFDELAAELRDDNVRLVGLCATLDPKADLERVRQLGLSFPAGTYAYRSAEPLAGVEAFPAVLVIDPDGNIVHRSNHWTAFEGLVRGMVQSGFYRRAVVSEVASDSHAQAPALTQPVLPQRR